MVKAGVVLGAVGQALDAAGDLAEEIFLLNVVLSAQLGHGVEERLEPLRRVEKRRFVHVVPEALDAKVRQQLIPPAEPFPHFGAQEIGKIGFSGPDGGHKRRAVSFFAEITLGQPFLTGRLIRVDADSGINDGDEPDALFFEVIRKLFQVREAVAVDGEIGVALHVIDVHADHIQGQIVLAVLLCDCADVSFGLVAPAALRQAKRPLRRDVAAPDEGAELPAESVFVPAGEKIEIVVRRLDAEGEQVVAGVADVVEHLSREIDEHAKAKPVVPDEQKIVRTIVRKFILAVVRLIGVVGDVVPAALVQPAGHLAQTVDHSILAHREQPSVSRFL